MRPHSYPRTSSLESGPLISTSPDDDDDEDEDEDDDDDDDEAEDDEKKLSIINSSNHPAATNHHRPPSQSNHHPRDPRYGYPASWRLNLLGSGFILMIIIVYFIIYYPHHQYSATSDRPETTPSSFHPTHLRKPSYLVSGKNGVVASEEGRCSRIGIRVLKANGTATDAAIATALCIGVLNSFASGIGGGGFMIVKPAPCRHHSSSNHHCTSYPQTPVSIDFRETVPDGEYYSNQFIRDPSKALTGGLAIAIPGELAGFHEAYKRFGGGITWNAIFQPAIQLASNFSVGHQLARRLANPKIRRWIDSKKEWSDIFFQSNREPSRFGDWIQRTAYARTLEIISREGIDPFYNGSIADQLIETINHHGGKVNRRDFENYRAILNPAINTTYHQYNIWTTGAPSSGPMLLHAINILERYALHHQPRSELSEHRFVEALKYAFSARTELGDPKFLNQTQLDRIELIRSKRYGHQTSLEIDDSKTYGYHHYKPKYDIVEDHGTTHLSVVDRFGSVVSLTSTVNLDFGSQVLDPVTGIILNDENDDFSIKGKSNYFDLFSSPLNYPQTGKRPISSMSPIIVDRLVPKPELGNLNPLDYHDQYQFFATLGASGGSRIFSSIIGTLLKLLWGYDLSHAIEDPRLHHQLLPNQIYVESSYRSDFLDSLRAKGHNISFIDIYYGKAAVHGIHRRALEEGEEEVYFGASDSRKNGIPDAY